MKYRVLLFGLSLFLQQLLWAQKENLPRTLTLNFGLGSSSILETYLTPYSYSGTDYRLTCSSETIRGAEKWLSRHELSLDYSQTTNFSGRGLYHNGFIDYNYHFLRRYTLSDRWLLAGGAGGDLLVGAIYNSRNSNNPAQAKLNLNSEVTALAEYRFKMLRKAVSVRYQTSVPLLGVGFAPEYGQSYYEIFRLGNSDGVVNLLSLHNQWAVNNRVTFQIPCYGYDLQIGYFNTIYQSRIHQNETSLISHNFTIGISGDFLRLDKSKR